MTKSNYPSLAERANFYDLKGAAEQGLLLPDLSAHAMEDALQVNEFDMMNRARLLGYYSRVLPSSGKNLKARVNHILWFIQNIPDCTFVGDLYFSIDKDKNPVEYAQVKNEWSRQLVTQGLCEQAKINAALFFLKFEVRTSHKLLKEVAKSYPENKWAEAMLGTTKPARMEFKPRTTDSANLEEARISANTISLQNNFSHGERMPPLSAETVEKVVAKFPDDFSARASLIGYYYRRAQRNNHIGCDPYAVSRLTKHLLWMIAVAPGCEFIAQFTDYGVVSRKHSPLEHKLLTEAWSETLKAFPKDAYVHASAACFNAAVGRNKSADKLEELAKKYSKNKKEIDRLMMFGVGNARRGREFVPPSKSEGRHALNTIAADTGDTLEKKTFDDYVLLEWCKEVDLGGAQLEGAYRWVPLSSIENLESVLEPDSLDVFNRARMIGCYDSEGGVWKNANQVELLMYGAHIKWFIDNIPESRFIVLFNLKNLHKNCREVYDLCRQSLLNNVESDPANASRLVNAILVLSQTEPTFVEVLLPRLSELDSPWAERVGFYLHDEEKVVDPSEKLREFGFREGNRKKEISKAAKIVGLTRQWLQGRHLNVRSSWTIEQVLRRNGNDLVLRSELIGLYDQLDQFHNHFCAYTPDYLEKLIEHNLWFIENVPDVFHYSLTSDLSLMSNKNSPTHRLGPQAILLEAAKRQINSYTENVSVANAMIHYFPYWASAAALKAMEKTRKKFPNNKELKSRLQHLEGFVSRETKRKGKRDSD